MPQHSIRVAPARYAYFYVEFNPAKLLLEDRSKRAGFPGLRRVRTGYPSWVSGPCLIVVAKRLSMGILAHNHDHDRLTFDVGVVLSARRSSPTRISPAYEFVG